MTTWYVGCSASTMILAETSQIDNLGFGKQERLVLNDQVLDETLSFR